MQLPGESHWQAVGLQDPPASSGSLRRFEFVSACEALLADSPGCASVGDLHALFDLLDPGCTGSVPLQKFSALLRAHQRPSTKAGAPLWTELGTVGQPPKESRGRLVSALNGLRSYMLQHSFLFQDLTALFDGVTKWAWPAFGERLTLRLSAPWVTMESAKEIFDQCKVVAVAPTPLTDASTLPSHEVHISDLFESLLDQKGFYEEMGKRALRVVFREAHTRRLDVKKQFRSVDANRSGLVDRKQLIHVLDMICPKALCDADVTNLAVRFKKGPRFDYESLAKLIENERCLYTEHLLNRALHKLETTPSLAQLFLKYATEVDISSAGFLTYSQLRHALSKVDLGLVANPGLEELADFIDILAKASCLERDKFKYGKLVGCRCQKPCEEKHWIGPSAKECYTVMCGSAKPKDYNLDENKPVAPPKQHLLTILFYKTSEAARKLGLSPERAFERLDRGGKGYIDAVDLRMAVEHVLGDAEATLEELGIKPDFVMRKDAFFKKLDFSMEKLGQHLEAVFGGDVSLTEKEFIKGYEKHQVDESTIKNWLALIIPGPHLGTATPLVQRTLCETFAHTHPGSPSPTPQAAGRDFAHSLAIRNVRKLLYQREGEPLRNMVMNLMGTRDLDPDISTPAHLVSSIDPPVWLRRAQVIALVQKCDGLSKEEADEVVGLVDRTSALYVGSQRPLVRQMGSHMGSRVEAPGCDARGEFLRTETLLLCAEAYEEHILEVRLEGIKGLDVMRGAIVSKDRDLEVSLRYWCRGTEYVAETARLQLSSTMEAADASAQLNFTATHTFNLNRQDQLLQLFEGSPDAISVQAWGGVVREPRQLLATASLKADDLRVFLAAAASRKRSPEALLGSQKSFALSFTGLPGPQLTLSVMYNTQSTSNQLTPPLPWPSAFTGSFVLCHKAPFFTSDTSDDVSGPATAPTPGKVKIEVNLRGLVLHSHALKKLLARCLEGCVMPAPVHGAGLGLFMRFCLFPDTPALSVAGGCAWVQSPPTMLPEEVVSTDFSAAGNGDTVLLSPDFVWHSPMLDAGEAVAALQQSKASVELWLRTSGASAADVRLAEGSVRLQELLNAASPQEPGQLRLRTLRNVSIEPTVVFKNNDEVLADLISTFSMDLPTGPSVVSWLVKPDAKQTLVSYEVRLREVLLSQEFTSRLIDETANRAHSFTPGFSRPAARSDAQYYYAEFGQGGPNGLGGPAPAGTTTATLPYYRSAPAAGQVDGGGWLRVPVEGDARVVLPKRPVLGCSDNTDVQIRRGDHHTCRVRVLRLKQGGGTQLVADVVLTLPVGEASEGGQSSFFGVNMWRPLYFAAPEAPSMTIVGRAVISVEAVHPHDDKSAPPRLLTDLPEMPTGVFLPLYKTWKVPVARIEKTTTWALEASLHAFVDSIAPDLWARLAIEAGEQRSIVTAEVFEGALNEANLNPELAFLKQHAAPFFKAAGSSVPWVQLFYWLALRAIADHVRPKMPQLLQHLQQLDRARDRMSGTVPLPMFMQALREDIALPTLLAEVIARRPQWAAGAAEFNGHAHFDYVAFLWDVNATGTGPKVTLDGDLPMPLENRFGLPPFRVTGFTSPGAQFLDVPYGSTSLRADNSSEVALMYDVQAMLTVVGAYYDKDGTNRAPSTFATFCWGRTLDETGRQDGERLGQTDVFPRDSSPKWNHMANVVLPPVQVSNQVLPYPGAFQHVMLVLQVWCVDEWSGTQRLIGTARVPLEPLRLGFAEVAGYYDIHASALGEPVSTGHVQGQIHVSLTPRWAPGPVERGPPPLDWGQRGAPAPFGWGGPSSFGQSGAGAFGLGGPSPLGPGGLGMLLQPASRPAGGIPFTRPEGISSWGMAPLPPPVYPPNLPAAEPVSPPALPSLARPERLPSAFTSSNEFDRTLRDRLYRPGLFDSLDADLRAVGQGPGVEDDVSTTALRFASRLSELEMRLRSIEGTEEEQMDQLWARHRSNLASLDQMQQGMLPPIASMPPAESYPSLPALTSAPLGASFAATQGASGLTSSRDSAPTPVVSVGPGFSATPFAEVAAASTVPTSSAAVSAPAAEAPTSLYRPMVPSAMFAIDLPEPSSSNFFPNFSTQVPSLLPQLALDYMGVGRDALGSAMPLPIASMPEPESVPVRSAEFVVAASLPSASVAAPASSAAVVAPPANARVLAPSLADRVGPVRGLLAVTGISEARLAEVAGVSLRNSYDLPQRGGSLLPDVPALPGSEGLWPSEASNLLPRRGPAYEELMAPQEAADRLFGVTGAPDAPETGVWPQAFGPGDDFAAIGHYVGLSRDLLRPGAFENADISHPELSAWTAPAAELSSSRQELLHQVGEDIRAGRGLPDSV